MSRCRNYLFNEISTHNYSRYIYKITNIIKRRKTAIHYDKKFCYNIHFHDNHFKALEGSLA